MIRLQLHIIRQTATLYLDLSGESLHRRGYRAQGGRAPIKETLAASIVKLSGFDEHVSRETFLLDPMCGSGTMLIEAAMLYGDIAPGLQRKSFGFMAWNRHNKRLWSHLVDEALAREELGSKKQWPPLLGFDADPQAIEAAKKNIVKAGLEDKIHVEQQDLFSLKAPGKNGFLVINPPYGERLAEKESVQYLYRTLGRISKQHFPAWQMGLFTSTPELADALQIQWKKRFRFYNGPIKCGLFVGKPGAETKQSTITWKLKKTNTKGKENKLGDRLAENFDTLWGWAKQYNITCFRLYDNELPEFRLTIDIYEKWFYVCECPAGKSVAPEEAKQQFNIALATIRNLFSVGHSTIFIKSLSRPHRKQRKATKEKSGRLFEVKEQDGFYLVNFTDYPCTGLHLEQRPIRKRLSSAAKNKKFLNLFGHTGTATVSAARGGACTTTTVDISEQYLAHARANLALNGFGGKVHQTAAADCLTWLNGCRETFDLILAVAPDDSISRKKGRSFDLRRDHEQLLRSSMKLLAREGMLFFSAESVKFNLSQSIQHDFIVHEMTKETIPDDFKKSKIIRRYWELRHPQHL